MIDPATIAAFRYLDTTLRQARPEIAEIADRLGDRICPVSELETDAVWSLLSEKPLYANSRIATGDNRAKALRKFKSDLWRVLGVEGSGYQISHTGRGIKRDSFSMSGSGANELYGATRIPLHRLYAVQGAARVFRSWVSQHGRFPASWLAKASPLERMLLLRRQLGFGWGTITVLHFLTDVGLGAKPDVHLVRSATDIGLIEPIIGAIPTELECVYIVEKVADLAKAVFGDTLPGALRYTDKVLMEASRQGLLPHRALAL